ncbi:hypothetical protein ACHQM5_029065 [Ranunculus cassubicifolius]
MHQKLSDLVLPSADEKMTFESPTPSKYIVSSTRSVSDSRRPRMTIERHQENHEFLMRCIKEHMGFKDGKPVSACIIYKCLLHWHAFESERTAIFDHIITGINDVLKVGDDDYVLPYWLSNASTLLCLLQRNLHSNARYPAILFKQQLTACVEKIFGFIRDNLKKELSPLLGLCITRRCSTTFTKQSLENIIKFLDSLLNRLRGNFVPSFFIRKLITQVFSFINISLFNSLLLRRECCTFSNGEYVKSGLAELEKWIVNTTEEFAGTSWHELNYIRQAVGFLVIHQKRKKSLEEIKQDLCPALTVRQICRICTMYWDDKYGTQSVSNEAVAEMRDILNKDALTTISNSFLLDDDLSIPFSTEDISKAIPAIEPSDVELPPFLRELPPAQFLVMGT